MRLLHWRGCQLHVGRTMYADGAVHRVDGRRHAPILTTVKADRYVFGRGGVLAAGPLMLWWTVDLFEVMP